MRCSRLPNSHFSFAEESILKICSPKARNLVSLPLEGKETAAGCWMRCSRRRRRYHFRMFAPHIPICVILSGESATRERSRTFAGREKPQASEQAKARGAGSEAGST